MTQEFTEAEALQLALRLMRETEGETQTQRLLLQCAAECAEPLARSLIAKLSLILGEPSERVATEILMGVGRVLNNGTH